MRARQLPDGKTVLDDSLEFGINTIEGTQMGQFDQRTLRAQASSQQKCMSPPRVMNSRGAEACSGKPSGTVCELACQDGYWKTGDLFCQHGEWKGIRDKFDVLAGSWDG
uniref:Sushi domain-containing protein n=1 Tax=Oxyrrhis marina TaxID=2969 RepID=A0A7S3XHX9_OXYMA